MSHSVDSLTADALQDTSRWFLRDATLKAANAVLVDHHHGLKLSSVWGDGSRSSSDGQRFVVERDSLLGSVYPCYFGYYDRALALYTHTSDQHSVYATQAISCTPREAGYVLGGILDNDTALAIREHTSDTHAFTGHLFGLGALLGIAFMPRLKDLPDQVLSRVDRDADYGALQPLLRGRINVALIGEQWDQLVRLAASLKDRLTPAHIVMQRLANANASDRLAGALTQLGRLMKTIHTLRYMQEAPLRDAIQLQLNPTYSATTGLTWRSPIDVVLSGETSLQGPACSDIQNTPADKLGARAIVNLVASRDFGRFTATVFVRNLFDEAYATRKVTAFDLVAPGPRRFVGAELRGTF